MKERWRYLGAVTDSESGHGFYFWAKLGVRRNEIYVTVHRIDRTLFRAMMTGRLM